jgi:hypothetical protein
MMRVVISKPPSDAQWHFEAAFFDEERDLAISDLQHRKRLQPERAFELQQVSDHVFAALTAALPIS